MNEPADLELSLRSRGGARYAADLVFDHPDSQANTYPLAGREVMVSFDLLALQALEADPVAYGCQLGTMLFASPSLAAAFASSRAAAQSNGRPLRLRIVIDTPELHDLRWETLRDPHDNLALALSEQIIFCRTLASANWRPITLRPKGDLRALVVIAAPPGLETYELAPIDAAAEQQRALTSLHSIPTTVLVAPGQSALPNIIAQLRIGYDLLYLVGHGSIVDGESWLFLDDGSGAVARVPGVDLVTRLADLPYPPRLVVLASCESASDGSRAAQAALGPRLAVAGIPAVIAMQGALAMETNATFAPTFFRELRRDGRIDRALAAARQAVAHKPDWWAMALFTRLRSGQIWYEPGFDEQDFQRWPALLQSISAGKCTPILGPGLLEGSIGPTRELAARLAETYHFPLAPFARVDLPQVTQYLAVNQSTDLMRAELQGQIRRLIGERHPALTPQGGGLLQLLGAVGQQRRAADKSEPHQTLAALPLPIYLTANPDDQLADALREAKRQPQVAICPWYVEELHYEQAQLVPPNPTHPLVYHLLGHLDTPDSLVVTEDEYFRYLIGVRRNVEFIPSAVQRALADTTLLLLGFRLEDWSFRALLQSLLRLSRSGRRGRYAHVTVQLAPQEDASLHPQAARKYLKDYLGFIAEQPNFSIYIGSTEDFMNELHQRWLAHQREVLAIANRALP
ncbi:MAG: CHAT domain-containing protein [Chloroflexales bacterium]|nr:CHAT domain-containing protein [Chloroflexales bacterium]